MMNLSLISRCVFFESVFQTEPDPSSPCFSRKNLPGRTGLGACEDVLNADVLNEHRNMIIIELDCSMVMIFFDWFSFFSWNRWYHWVDLYIRRLQQQAVKEMSAASYLWFLQGDRALLISGQVLTRKGGKFMESLHAKSRLTASLPLLRFFQAFKDFKFCSAGGWFEWWFWSGLEDSIKNSQRIMGVYEEQVREDGWSLEKTLQLLFCDAFFWWVGFQTPQIIDPTISVDVGITFERFHYLFLIWWAIRRQTKQTVGNQCGNSLKLNL